VTLLVAVAVPFCCCSFRSWLGAQATCHRGVPLVASAAAPNDELPPCHRHLKGVATVEKDDTDPATPEVPRGDPDGPCTCGKHYIGAEPISIDFTASPLIAVLPVGAPDLTTTAFAVRAAPHGLVPPRPQTSLLRLHCALLV
jgi:hypothetical protein